ncbi:CapA family protein [Wenxinia marina]|uniref:Putative enzyme of poly-gamma-glutamate biosynthesis (Capsule formation) n=1 Tax=Wenxinia marina DSM 24838 TaxID=1123501 RepID=A0A0D0Q9C6_9RHOB|nr:CapA family protein [Wenxinia marina]KIQ68972.1 Putative enzyme of poly-gamma-glutamate biosynthesis (capsule formation) [Wenxinia marina DSM 24838]GGL63650.1 hypothetical protein GCM10011392_17990 [Wenxinia marina]
MLRRAALLALALMGGPAAAQTCRAVYDAVPPALNPCADGRRVTAAFVGDVLLHSPLQRQGYAEGFGPMWAAAEPFLSEADLAVANLEGPVAAGIRRSGGQGVDPGAVFDNLVHTSYPMFNYHASVLPALSAAGVDVVTTANNHALDRFSAGADATIAAVAAAGLGLTGTIRAGAERTFATSVPGDLGEIVLLSCTFSTNGVPDAEDQVLGCYSDETLSLIRLQAARPEVAGVIVLPHWGVEYVHSPLAIDRALAARFVAAGAVAVIGTHPHVIQSWDVMRGPAGQVPVVYSTGNFVSGQPGLARETGALVRLELCMAGGGDDLASALRARMTVANAGWVALRMIRGARRELAMADESGVAAAAQPAHDLIERHVPGRALMPRLVCDGAAAPELAALPVLLQ